MAINNMSAPHKPTLREVRERWTNMENRGNVPTMIFTSHAKMDIDVLLETIDDLKDSLAYAETELETEDT